MPVPAYEIDEHERGLAPWKGEVALPGWRESHAPLRYVHRNASNASNATANATRGEYNSWRSFSGTRTSAARRFALRGCGAAATHCGFVGASPFDAAAATTRALGAHWHAAEERAARQPALAPAALVRRRESGHAREVWQR